MTFAAEYPGQNRVAGQIRDLDESMVDLRCSIAVIDDGRVLLIHRTADGRNDWVLPGGRPRTGERLSACAGREAREETGLEINPMRVAFVPEVIDLRTRTVYLGNLWKPVPASAADGSAGRWRRWTRGRP